MKLYTADIIINTLIAINKKEKRNIIDSTDIENYKKELNIEANKRNTELVIEKNPTMFRKLFDYLYFTDEKDNRFILLPWYNTEDLLIAFNNNKSEEDIELLLNDNIINNIEKRTIEDIEELEEIENIVTNMYITKTKAKIDSISKEKQKEEKKLIKIYENKTKN